LTCSIVVMHLPVKQKDVGPNPTVSAKQGSLAQSVEQGAFNSEVVGANPT
jgi:hypothetical protein